MRRFRTFLFRVLAALLALACAPILDTCRADVTLDVSLDVTGLRANTYGGGAPYSVDFFMSGGQGNNDSVSISHFAITAASLGTSSSTGDILGTLATKLTVGDTPFFNDYNQVIKPDLTSNPVVITFQMTATTNFASGVIPDNFAFSILDTSGNPIPTTDTFASTLLNFDLTPGLNASQVSVFQTTDTPVPVIGPPSVTAASAVPEPSSSLVVLATTALCLTGLAAARARSSAVRRK
jgi:hypothetical protein